MSWVCFSAERPERQGEDSSYGFKRYYLWHCTGGLSFKLGEARPAAPNYPPRLFLNSVYSSLTLATFEIPGGPLYFIRSVGVVGTGKSSRRTATKKSWVYLSATYGNLTIYVSRLTPAVLLETTADAIGLSNPPLPQPGKRSPASPPEVIPVYASYLGPDGELQTLELKPGVEVDSEPGEVKWLLMWYGNVFRYAPAPLVWQMYWWMRPQFR